MSFRLQRASVAYNGTAALSDVDLEIADGEAVAIVGPSGSGKTTLLRLLNGTVRPSAGSVEVGGQRLDELSSRALRRVRAKIGFVHQDLALVPNLRVLQNVVSGRLGRYGFWRSLKEMTLPAKSSVKAAHEILERVGIREKLYQRVDALSGGQAQRVAIARALFQGPDTLLADEPVSAVDPARARDTVALLARISREEGLTLCVSLHNLALAREFFPRLVGLRAGRVAFDRTTADLSDSDFGQLYELADDEMLGNA